jgi:C1A family cysteine protease
VGHSATALKMWQDLKDHGWEGVLARMFVYYTCKAWDGAPNEEGTYPRVALDVLSKVGVCQEALYPFPGPHPRTQQMNHSAWGHRISSYARVTTLLDLKTALIAHGPCVIGIDVYANFPMDNASRGRPGTVPLPAGNLIGGHAILLVGWTSDNYLIFRNSWGRTWGDQGNGYLPTSYPNLYADCWSSVDLDQPVPHTQVVRGAP